MSGVHSYLPEDDKTHLGRLLVSADAIRRNIGYFRNLLKQETGIMLIVKASAYGHGAIDIARLVQKEELVEYLAVVDVDEGIELRKAGIELPILILNPSRIAFAEMVEHCLEPEIHHLSLLVEFQEFLASANLDDSNYPVHLKLNTGMNRLGFDMSDLDELIDLIKHAQGWEVRSMLTHLSCTGNESEDEFSYTQLKQFESMYEKLKPFVHKDTWLHALNTDGIQRFPNHHYQMVRLGIGVYGGSSLKVLKDVLTPCCKFICRISQSRRVKAGASIGYGRVGKVDKDTNIATLSIGYADGLNRNLSNGNWEVEIEGKLYPIIGNICMDICMIDLGDDWYEPQTLVTIFGGIRDIHDYAKAQNTISYEAMTSLSARVKRIMVD